MKKDIREFINSQPIEPFNEFLRRYPYAESRKLAVIELMGDDNIEPLLMQAYTNILNNALDQKAKNGNKGGGIILYRVWAFSIMDEVADELNEVGAIGADELKTIIKKMIDSKNEE